MLDPHPERDRKPGRDGTPLLDRLDTESRELFLQAAAALRELRVHPDHPPPLALACEVAGLSPIDSARVCWAVRHLKREMHKETT